MKGTGIKATPKDVEKLVHLANQSNALLLTHLIDRTEAIEKELAELKTKIKHEHGGGIMHGFEQHMFDLLQLPKDTKKFTLSCEVDKSPVVECEYLVMPFEDGKPPLVVRKKYELWEIEKAGYCIDS